MWQFKYDIINFYNRFVYILASVTINNIIVNNITKTLNR